LFIGENALFFFRFRRSLPIVVEFSKVSFSYGEIFSYREKTGAQKDFYNDLHKQERSLKRSLLFMLIALGIIIVFAGFMYDVLFAGIPYQDPTPALAASYNFHSQIASIIRWSGIGICIIGGMAMVIRWLTMKGRNQRV
jgi:hypothetical protein